MTEGEFQDDLKVSEGCSQVLAGYPQCSETREQPRAWRGWHSAAEAASLQHQEATSTAAVWKGADDKLLLLLLLVLCCRSSP